MTSRFHISRSKYSNIYLEAIDVEIWAHEGIEQKELTANIDHIQQLDEHVQGADVVARSVVGQEAAGDLASDAANNGEVIVVAVVVYGAIDQLDRVSHGLVARVAVGRIHRVDDLHDRLGVQAARLSHQVPHEKGRVEEQSHEGQDERHPLIVVDHVLARLARVRQRVVGGHKVRVGDPANVVGVLDHGAGELSRRPARDRRAHELRRADEQGEHDQQADRVAVIQPVREVIVLDLVGLDDFFNGVHELPDHSLSNHFLILNSVRN
jgi:hypothetical protein